VSILIEWGKAFQVAFVGLSGVFAGLILLEICVNLFSRVVRIVERSSISKEKQ
jgi:hypothetical protein